jgi:ribonuclease HI
MIDVTIYVDGAAIPTNPGRGGAGIIYSTWRDGLRFTREYGFYLGDNVTNNAAEIRAAIKALDKLKEPCNVTIISDSQYVINTMTKGWRRNANQELWRELDRAASRHTVAWQWIKGHSGDLFNEWADELANKAAKLRKDVTE